MKFFTLSFLMLFSISFLYAQSDEVIDDSRKGAYFIEAGYNVFGGTIGSSGTGITSLAGDNDENLTALGFEGGRFMTENLALKLRVGGITTSNGFGTNSLGSIGLGGKYYIKGKVPIELMFVSFNDDQIDESTGIASLIAAYAFSLADNIYLELGLGVLNIIDDEESLGIFKMSFTMVL